jgi:hypothetical protein
MNPKDLEERMDISNIAEGTDQGGNHPMDTNLVIVDPVNTAIVNVDPMNKIQPVSTVAANNGSLAALLNSKESEDLRVRWNDIQGRFVDEPRTSVQQADALVTEVVEKIIQMFAEEHDSLESQWNQGTDVSTEDLRMALQHYRSFFNRLVI